MKKQPLINLSDSGVMPQIGLGVWRADNQQARDATLEAFRTGYRSVDTASVYNNERGVGQALRLARDLHGLSRDQYFVTTKLWNDCHGYDDALKSCEESLARLGLDWVDLYLIQWPAPGRDRYVEAWKALLRLKKDGRVRAVGVSNFLPHHLDRLMDETGERPAVNQIELHPHFQQNDLCEATKRRGVKVEAWAPLGCGAALSDPLFIKLAQKHLKTPAQVVLRWHLDLGRIAIPKSVRPTRIKENFGVFDFRLDAEDLRQIALLDRGRRLGPNPATFS